MITGCSEDDYTGLSQIDYNKRTVTLSSSSNNVTFDESMIDPEDESTYSVTVTATIEEASPVNIVIPLVQTGGTGDSGDFSAGTITIPAGFTSASTTVEILQDCESAIEGDETLEIGAANNIANANVNPFTLNIAIENDWVNDELVISVSWKGTHTFIDDAGTEVTIDFCNMDLDTLLADGMGNILDYISGTSNCTEEGGISGLADGTYYIIVDMYENPFEGYYTDEDGDVVNVSVPLTTSYSQCGFTDTSGSFVTESLTTNIANPVSDPHAPGEVAIGIATVEVTDGYNYVVTPL
ncbi:MAG: hypothetical protein ACK5M1_09785 [Xanthomarina gelatinilytica]|uniref:hypothetical protein n=1 Tax=Xanthomarina gelatinilytica TaxID=1137281 RepID=UPI003A88D159